jgi:hypothetical protein
MGTRAKNAEAHPGADPAMQKRKCRMKAEMEADAEKKSIQKAAKAEKKQQGVKRITQVKNEVAEQDANLVTLKPRPRPRPLQRTISILPSELEEMLGDPPTDNLEPTNNPEPSDVEPPSTCDTEGEGELTEIDEAPPKEKGKREKGSMRDAIQVACQTLV